MYILHEATLYIDNAPTSHSILNYLFYVKLFVNKKKKKMSKTAPTKKKKNNKTFNRRCTTVICNFILNQKLYRLSYVFYA